MFSPISIDTFMQARYKNNPKEDIKTLRANLTETVQRKKDGAVCEQCGQSIWAIGSAISGWNACHTCITGEADNSSDYEINSVCF
jgi:hypothetical protein